MEKFLPLLFIGGGLAIFAVVLGVAHVLEKKRLEALRRVADGLGLPFHAEGDLGLVDELSTFDLFSKGRDKHVWHLIRGEAGGVELALFDYRFTTGSGKQKHTAKQTVFFVQSSQLTLPRFTVRPESLLHKLGKLMGVKDIDFAEHPQFSSMFLLQGTQENRLKELFQPNLIQWFESRRGICVEGYGNRLIVYRPRERAKPEAWRQLMEDGFEVFRVLSGA